MSLLCVRCGRQPNQLFSLFEPLFGKKCIQYADGASGRGRRRAFDRVLSLERVGATHGEVVAVIAAGSARWGALADTGTPMDVHEEMMSISLQVRVCVCVCVVVSCVCLTIDTVRACC